MALNKELIASCALEICEKKGFEAISMRLLAKKLDVTPMALYRHIGTKNELLNLIASEYLQLYRQRIIYSEDPREMIFNVYNELRIFVLDKPVLAHIIVTQPLDSAAAYEVGEILLAVLHEAGFANSKSAEIFTVLTSYTLGYAMQSLARRDMGDPASLVSRREKLRDYPNLRGLADQWARNSPDLYFENGLRNMIASYENDLPKQVA